VSITKRDNDHSNNFCTQKTQKNGGRKKQGQRTEIIKIIVHSQKDKNGALAEMIKGGGE